MWHSIEVKVGFGIWVVETCVNIKGTLSENDIGAEASTSYSMYIYIYNYMSLRFGVKDEEQ